MQRFSLVLHEYLRAPLDVRFSIPEVYEYEPQFYVSLVQLMMEFVQVVCSPTEACVLDSVVQSVKSVWVKDFGSIPVKIADTKVERSLHELGLLRHNCVNKGFFGELQDRFQRTRQKLLDKLEFYETFLISTLFMCPRHVHLIHDDVSSDSETEGFMRTESLFQLHDTICTRSLPDGSMCGLALVPHKNGKPWEMELPSPPVFDEYPPVNYTLLNWDEEKDHEEAGKEEGENESSKKACVVESMKVEIEEQKAELKNPYEMVERMKLWYRSSVAILDKLWEKFAPTVEYLKTFRALSKLRKCFVDKPIGAREVEFRNYQHDAVQSLQKHMRGVVIMPCGAGKTHTGILAMLEIQQGKILVVTSSHESLRQWFNTIFNVTSLHPVSVHRVSSASTVQEVSQAKVVLTTYTMLTWRRNTHTTTGVRAWLQKQHWELQIMDEVHMCTGRVFRDACLKITCKYRLGLTATLKKRDHVKRIKELVGNVVHEVSMDQLKSEGFVVPVSCVYVCCPTLMEMPSNKAVELACAPGILATALKLLKSFSSNEKILVLSEYLQPLKLLHRRVPGADLVYGQTKDRVIAYERFISGSTNILFLSRVGDMAVNLPNCTRVISLNFKYGSTFQGLQRAGRAARPAPEKKDAVMYFLFADHARTEYYAMMSAYYIRQKGLEVMFQKASITRQETEELLRLG